ncbi:MAG: polyprenyl synthetase family protein [Phycisphaerales bacterium]|nr:polyprenyl synthetase family protein [Phycisphaerales bacterium]
MSLPVPIPDSLAPLQAFLAGALARVEARFDLQLRSDLPPVSKLCTHIERYRGKMLRPTLAILAGLAADPRAAHAPPEAIVSEDHILIAAVCEMVHMATLVHDDVLDEAETRRRGRTVNRLHGNEAAVILGDYLIASAYHLCSQLADQSIALEIARVSMTLCAGELLQLHHRRDYSLDEPTYFEILDRKTAALIAAAAELGARRSAPEASPAPRLLADYGRRLGVAFQIQDDLLDLTGQDAVVGKPTGRDVQKGKLTLPLIHHLAAADATLRGHTLRLLERLDEHADPEARSRLLDALESTESIDHARKTAERLVREAQQALGGIHDSQARRLLDLMARAVIARSF